MSAHVLNTAQKWMGLFTGLITIAFIVHASGEMTERLAEHDKAIVLLKEADRESQADRRALAVLMQRCITTLERIDSKPQK